MGNFFSVRMNKRGGGLTKVNDFDSDEMKLFAGGLRNTKDHSWKLIYNTTQNIRNLHDWISYERGMISHSRSPHAQYMNFHHGYGGMYKWMVNRYWKDVIWRRVIRVAWAPCLLWHTFTCVTMRQHDNAAYDYFYFSD